MASGPLSVQRIPVPLLSFAARRQLPPTVEASVQIRYNRSQ
jgi:hypothetical protein